MWQKAGQTGGSSSPKSSGKKFSYDIRKGSCNGTGKAFHAHDVITLFISTGYGHRVNQVSGRDSPEAIDDGRFDLVFERL